MISLTLSLIASLSPLPWIIVVVSFFTTTLVAEPKSVKSAFFNSMFNSLVKNLAPVTIAISFSISFCESPKLGAFVATTLNVPLNLLTIRVVNASLSISSAMINKGLLV